MPLLVGDFFWLFEMETKEPYDLDVLISDESFHRREDCCPVCESDEFVYVSKGIVQCQDCRYIGTRNEFRF